jgi:hypothetical protein
MRIPQLSIVVDNQPGALLAPCQALTEAGINIVTLSLSEHRQYGTLRLIVAEWQKARDLLEAAGFTVTVTEVLAIEVLDEPGGLLELLRVFHDGGINVATMYAYTSRLGDSAVLVFNFDNIDAAIQTLTHAGINPVAPVHLYDRIDEDE